MPRRDIIHLCPAICGRKVDLSIHCRFKFHPHFHCKTFLFSVCALSDISSDDCECLKKQSAQGAQGPAADHSRSSSAALDQLSKWSKLASSAPLVASARYETSLCLQEQLTNTSSRSRFSARSLLSSTSSPCTMWSIPLVSQLICPTSPPSQ